MRQERVQADGLYKKLNNIMGDMDEQSQLNQEFIKDALEIMFVTDPIEESTPFAVELMDDSGDALEILGSGDFSVRNHQVLVDTNSEYKIEFYALTLDNEYVYEFSALFEKSGMLNVFKAQIYRNTDVVSLDFPIVAESSPVGKQR